MFPRSPRTSTPGPRRSRCLTPRPSRWREWLNQNFATVKTDLSPTTTDSEQLRLRVQVLVQVSGMRTRYLTGWPFRLAG